MLTNDKEKRICNKYSAKDEHGLVQCERCPLRKGTDSYDCRCKANAHYNRSTHEWEYDEIRTSSHCSNVDVNHDTYCIKISCSDCENVYDAGVKAGREDGLYFAYIQGYLSFDDYNYLVDRLPAIYPEEAKHD